ncbi:MAG TPA: ribosome recycling factor [Dehalococcoidia bacterium]|jgi:ribosome recycling factor|nr:ribosome recycling factor [Dehalococcoidia bacterium]
MTDEILLDTEDLMDKAVGAYERDLATVRTGRASTSLVDHLMVEYYGQTMPLDQLATLAAPDATLITVQAWDQGAVDAIMRAIQLSDLGINPSSDGSLIRLPVPPLTEDRRKALVKQLHGRTEEAKVSVRNARRHGIDELRKALREKEVSEDEERRAQGEVDKLASARQERLKALAKQKEQELLEV